MNALDRLWEEYRLPIRDAMYVRTAEGIDAFEVVTSPGEPGKLVLSEPFELESLLAESPDWTSEVDGQQQLALEAGGVLWAGEGSHGSEGFFARLTAERSLLWAVFLEDSNPFTEIHLKGRVATFTSTADVVVTLNVDDPTGRVVDD
ncbi:hypothetical protein ABZ820_27005 [Streptomyces diacarni]|uniref:hypothetical protein n=1 Tax=Streptomyces diacarni TaxID=2800381 RepID=UPI003411EAAA